VLRFGARACVIAGLVPIAVGLALFAQAPADVRFATDLLPAMLLIGAGGGVCFPALMNLAMSSATPSDAGLASGLVNTTAQVGGALALAVLATLSSSRADALARGGASPASALTGGYHLALWIAAALVACGILAALAIVPRATSERALPVVARETPAVA
jgi:MFS family permease